MRSTTVRILLVGALAGVPLRAHLSTQHEEIGNRDDWQRPAVVMDALRIGPGSRVADIGAGTGYFTFHLAQRVGAAGRAYAVDVQRAALEDINRRASALALTQITTILGTDNDPHLPPESLDVVLVVNTYHELRAYDAMMQGFWRGLKAGGLLAIIDCEAVPGELPESYVRHHRVPSSAVRNEAIRNGFRFLRSELGFVDPATPYSYWYFLVFERPS
jgi:ubiquinone/menaquinone biosynthesis C-methylase UbiE